MAEAKEREAFEKWADERNFDLDDGDDPDCYFDIETDAAWRAWQASRSAVLEEAAQYIEREYADSMFAEHSFIVRDLRSLKSESVATKEKP